MNTSQKIRVKFLFRGQENPQPIQWLRQFPGQNPSWGQCEYIFDKHEREYDWLVVDNDLPPKVGSEKSSAIEPLACPKAHTLFITREPSSVSTYGRDFLKQFSHVLSGHEYWALKHHGKIHSQPALRWYYGDSSRNGAVDMRDYDWIVAHPPMNKTKNIATVCSAKAQKHTMHYQRLQFIERLNAVLSEMDRFGEGFKEIPDKALALDSYKYHIAIENHICDHWWTEKLSDSFLGMTLPFYYGAPNAAEYFPAESFIPIDINDFEGSLKIIRSAIENGEYEKRLEAIKKARQLAIEEYSTFAVVSKIIEARHTPQALPSENLEIKGKHALRKNPLIAIRIALEKTYMRLRTLRNKSAAQGGDGAENLK
jgi:hypothetical protein